MVLIHKSKLNYRIYFQFKNRQVNLRHMTIVTHADRTKENKSHSNVSERSQVSKGINSVFQFADNRQETLAQRKLYDMANNSPQTMWNAQLKAFSDTRTETSSQMNDNVIQLNKHTKRLLNLLSLGIRKAYTYNKKKKMANAVQNSPLPDEPANSPEDDFVSAYEKSRYYQQTDPQNFPSIEQHGLLNYEDRERLLPENVIGMSRLGGEFEGDEKKGVYLGPKHFMKENKMTKNVARAFMPAERTKLHHWTEEKETPPNEMYRDEKFRGGAVITKNSIPPEQVTTENILELLENDNPKLKSILTAVGSQYEGEAPDYEIMKIHLSEAILKRRLSNAAFDDK